ncbi:DUF3124 domain-containing protein [Desulfomarina sp.]
MIYRLLLFFLLFTPCSLQASEPFPPVMRQKVYVPAYSHIYHGNKETPLLLSITLSIRNVDPLRSLTVTTVDYYETQGKLLKHFIVEPVLLPPMGSTRFIVPQKDTTGGSGANFIVSWKAEEKINPPIIESVMIGTQSQLGISFTSRGRAIF